MKQNQLFEIILIIDKNISEANEGIIKNINKEGLPNIVKTNYMLGEKDMALKIKGEILEIMRRELYKNDQH